MFILRIVPVALALGSALTACQSVQQTAATATATATKVACPAGVADQLNGLYQWQVQRMEQRSDPVEDLSSQRQRFTPSLFELLLKATSLTSRHDGRYLDFDVFSNTQAQTFGAVVTGCSEAQGNRIEADVDVNFGLVGRASDTPRQLRYEMLRDNNGRWRINNITYLDEPIEELRPLLKKLLNPSS